MPPSVSPIELLWVVASLLGVAFNTWALADAYGDRTALDALGRNGARRLVASGNIRREWIRTFKQALFLALGCYLLTVPPATPGRPVTATGAAVALALLAANISMVAGSIADRAERHTLIAKIDRELEGKVS